MSELSYPPTLPTSIALKQCRGECGLVKPITEFYKHPESADGFSGICKECQRAVTRRNRKHGNLRKPDSGRPSEQHVIDHLRSIGIYAVAGSASQFKWVDIVCWGCVRIEVKTAVDSSRQYDFAFTPTQIQRGVLADLILLVCSGFDNGANSYHLFPVDHSIFYRDDKLKKSVSYIIGGTPRKRNRYWQTVVPTDELMTQHKDAWHLIEEKRLEISERLKTP